MKKSLFILAATLLFGSALADTPIDYNKIPTNAKAFITKHFSSAKVSSATVDKDLMDAEYTVYLDNGTKVEFNNKGSWKEVNCGMNAVPATIIPANIAKYLSTNYNGHKVVKIDSGRTDYEVKLLSGAELKFDLQGKFLRIDD